MSHHFAVLAALFGLAVSTSACGGDARDPGGDGGTGSSVLDGVAETANGSDSAAADTSAPPGDASPRTGDTTVAPDPADPFAGFRLEAPLGASEDTSRISLLLRNDASTDAIVYADGGAGEVLLDTVPAASAVRVDVITRARTILLRSASPAGEELRSAEVRAGTDSVVEVPIGRSADSM